MEAEIMTDTVPGDMHDGLTARRHAVTVTWDDAGLSLAGEGIGESIGWASLTWLDAYPEALLIGRSDRAGWRLRLPPDAPAGLVAKLPQRPRFGRWIDRFGFGKSLALYAAISSAVVFVAINTPGWLGRRIPVAWETGMSDDGLGDLAGHTCHTPASDAALARLGTMLDQRGGEGQDDEERELPARIELVKFGAVNAVALPGGRVLVFDGLVQQMESPEALAGVIGHELGHVRQRHVMQAMLREFGLSMVLSGFRSGVTNTLGRMTALRYSREAESEADDWARSSLARAGISPLPVAAFLDRTAEDDPGTQFAMAGYLSSHPDPIGRAESFRASLRTERPYRAALGDAEFLAILQACEEDGKATPWMPE